MKYIISKDANVVVDGFLTLSSIDELSKEEDLDLDTSLIVHSFKEDDYTASLELATIVEENNINEIFYINNTPSPSMSAFIQSINGTIEEDEDYLRDNIELNSLLKVRKKELALVDEGALLSQTEFLTELLISLENGDESVFSKVFTQMLQRLVLEVETSKEQDDENILNLQKLVKGTYLKTKKEIDKIKTKNIEVENSLNEIMESVNKSTGMPTSQNITYFPPVPHFKSEKVIVFKEYTSCRYLTSFVTNFAEYLSRNKKLRVKVIIVGQANGTNECRYKGIPEVTSQNYKNAHTLTSEVVYTTFPTKSLMEYQMGNNSQVVLVLDRGYSKDIIIKGKVSTIHCVSGVRELKNYNLNKANVLTSIISIPDTLGSIQHIKNFSNNLLDQKQAIQKSCKPLYDSIYLKMIKQ